MPTPEDYAALSTLVYNIEALEINQLTIPALDGWTVLATVNDAASGLYAQAFRRADDIIIAFKGTDDGLSGRNRKLPCTCEPWHAAC